MLILGISSKYDLKTPSECLNFCVYVCMCVCVCVCVCVSNKEQVAWAPSSPPLNPASSFLHQLITTLCLLLLLLVPVSSSFLYFSLIKIIHVYPTSPCSPPFFSACPCLSISLPCLFSFSLSLCLSLSLSLSLSHSLSRSRPGCVSSRLQLAQADYSGVLLSPGGGQREQHRNLI